MNLKKVREQEKVLLTKIAQCQNSENNQLPSSLNNLVELTQKHPGIPIVPMVDGEVVSEEGSIRWMGSFGSSYLAKVYIGKDRVYFFDDTCHEDIDECLRDSGLFWETCDLSEEDALTYYRNLSWKSVIAVNIDMPEDV